MAARASVASWNLFLAKEFRKVGSLKPQRFGRPGLVPVVFFQRVFEHPTTVSLHHRVITGCVAWPVLNPFCLTRIVPPIPDAGPAPPASERHKYSGSIVFPGVRM